MQKAFELNSVYSVEESKLLIQQIRILSGEIRKKYCCNNNEFGQIRESKLNKKGGFDKGYVVYQSVIENEEQEDFLEMLPASEPIDIYELKEKEKIEIDNIKNNKLLLRMRFPIYSKKIVGKFLKERLMFFLKRK